jgi:hypothetical protein
MEIIRIYIPKPIIEWFLIRHYDFKLYGVRIHKDSVSYNEDGYMEIEYSGDNLEYWHTDLEDKLKNCMYLFNHPKNIKYNRN